MIEIARHRDAHFCSVTDRSVHIALGLLFLVLWIGTFVTGVFYLPHQ